MTQLIFIPTVTVIIVHIGRRSLLYRPIPFEDVLTILVSIFYLSRDQRNGRESERLSVLGEGRKEGVRLLNQTESVYIIVYQCSAH